MTVVEFSHELTVEYIQHMGSDAMICQAAKVSQQAITAKDAGESERLIKFLASERHGTPFEHTAMTFMFTEPIFVTREFHRHRVGWSYNEESSRWRVMDARFYLPPPERPVTQVGRAGEYKLVGSQSVDEYNWATKQRKEVAEFAYERYERQLEFGIAREVARQVLPVNLYTSFFATCNARSLMHFLSLRQAETALWEIRQVANKAYDIFEGLFPLTAHAFVEAGRIAP
jgi:thymidylate synthase (FAD)